MARAASAIARLGTRARSTVAVTATRMHGGESLTSIPKAAWFDLDVRSANAAALARTEADVHRLVHTAVREESAGAAAHGTVHHDSDLRAEIMSSARVRVGRSTPHIRWFVSPPRPPDGSRASPSRRLLQPTIMSRSHEGFRRSRSAAGVTVAPRTRLMSGMTTRRACTGWFARWRYWSLSHQRDPCDDRAYSSISNAGADGMVLKNCARYAAAGNA